MAQRQVAGAALAAKELDDVREHSSHSLDNQDDDDDDEKGNSAERDHPFGDPGLADGTTIKVWALVSLDQPGVEPAYPPPSPII